MVDWRLVLYRLRPSSGYHWMGDGINDSYASIGEWRDPNTTKPTEAECLAEWDIYLAEKAAQDAVDAQILAEAETAETQKLTFRTLPEWATWTPAEGKVEIQQRVLNGLDKAGVDAWIDANVTGSNIATLRASVITALKLLGGGIVALREIVALVGYCVLLLRDVAIRRTG